MLETEIKKLTAAVEANTAALLGGAAGAVATPPAATPAPAGPAATAPVTPAVATPPGAAAAMPTMPGSAVPPGAVPLGAAAAAQPMTHQMAQAELVTIAQQLGDGVAIQQVMVKYGGTQLNLIPAENLFSLVQECKALVQA